MKYLKNAWAASRPLTATCLIMTAALLLSMVGLIFDHRTITGAPAWLKPAKFALSTALYAGTVAWIFHHVRVWPCLIRFLGRVLAAVLLIEVAIIDLQAARGTTSHFNLSTPLNATLFGIMGICIAILLLASIAVVVALFRQRFTEAAFGWSLRLGMLITVLGASLGGLMTAPTHEQKQLFASHQTPRIIGGHTIGAIDGGRALPVVGWSANHGDLRIPHFLGLHAIQILPLIYFLLRRRKTSEGSLPALVGIAAASYFTLVAILTWQALRGQSIAEPDARTVIALAVWFIASVCGFTAFNSKIPNESFAAQSPVAL